jgi:hypothetical protein
MPYLCTSYSRAEILNTTELKWIKINFTHEVFVNSTRALATRGKVQTKCAELGIVHLNKFNAGIFILVLYDKGY